MKQEVRGAPSKETIGAEGSLNLIFSVGERRFAIELNSILGVNQLEKGERIDWLEGSPLGKAQFRNREIPVINLHKRLCLPSFREDLSRFLLVIEHHLFSLGLLVDQVDKIINLSRSRKLEFPLLLRNKDNLLLNGFYPWKEDLIISLNKEELVDLVDVSKIERL